MPVQAATISVPSFLRETLDVLVVEDNPQALDWLCGCLERCPLLAVHGAANVDEAVAALQLPGSPMHYCVMDLGLPEAEDGYGLLAKYAAAIPFVVVTARNSIDEASRCHDLKAVSVLGKTTLDTTSLVRFVSTGAVRHKLFTLAGDDPYLRKALSYLFSCEPRQVGSWIGGLNTDENHFRKKWSQRGLQPKAVLYCYLAYRYAISNQQHEQRRTGLEGALQRACEWLAVRGDVRERLLRRAC